MATAAELLAAVATVVATETSGTRLTSDYRVDLEAIALGATRYQLQGGPAGEQRDSNSSRVILAIQILVHHRLADPDAERTYTEGAMQTSLDALVQQSTYTALPEVYGVEAAPTYTVERVTNIITSTIQLQLSIAG